MKKNIFLAVGLMAAVLLVGAGCNQDKLSDADSLLTDQAVVDEVEIQETEAAEVDKGPAELVVEPVAEPEIIVKEVEEVVEETAVETVDLGCLEIPENLAACIPTACQFVHPLTGETMWKEITALTDGTCLYVEEMPNNGQLKCDYTESQRQVAAQYYTDVLSGESAGTSTELDLETGEQVTTYTIDGEEVENPLQTFTMNGICQILGY